MKTSDDRAAFDARVRAHLDAHFAKFAEVIAAINAGFAYKPLPQRGQVDMPKAPKHKRCPRCNQRLFVVNGQIEPHMQVPSPYGGMPRQCLPGSPRRNGEL